MKARLKSSTKQNEGQNCNISFSFGFIYLDTGASTSHAVTNLAVTGDKPFTIVQRTNRLTKKTVCAVEQRLAFLIHSQHSGSSTQQRLHHRGQAVARRQVKGPAGGETGERRSGALKTGCSQRWKDGRTNRRRTRHQNSWHTREFVREIHVCVTVLTLSVGGWKQKKQTKKQANKKHQRQWWKLFFWFKFHHFDLILFSLPIRSKWWKLAYGQWKTGRTYISLK